MAHSYPNVLIHCVFSTKNRTNTIPETLSPMLYRYFIGIGKNLHIGIIDVGGIANHVHLLMALPSDISLAKAIQALKANSSRWLREHGVDFAWQEGYAAFSVSASQREGVRRYIENQAEHHRRRTFEDEFVALLQKSGVKYDPHFVFG
jgi:putative transposase